ncbi:cytochrome C assembly family protein [Sapientia aquatica]|uniref:Inner membrane protein YpjD n=1 Tax=Sapientia aquatica TaxID=1549640 RepID=A0A4R5VYE7_9BURK|nr:cytochrome c biogenesis protein CcsA [Sapientia aquatica]TDK64530.1 inner membrane protein YpjD [Sapientia aquatica]
MQTYFTIIAAALYASCLFLPTRPRWLISLVIVFGWLFHGAALGMEISSPVGIRLGFALMLSSALWISVFAYWLENWQLPLEGLRLLILPSAAFQVLLPVFFPGQLISMSDKSIWFPAHIAIALLAYSALTIAAFHAVLMTMQEARLRNRDSLFSAGWLGAALERLPALLMMERILFRLVLIGFVLLSFTVVSGLVFSKDVFGVAMRWDHKTIFTLLSWILFGVLLGGRHWRGWRGKTALSLTLSGFATLLLAYVGSRFVFEVILHRSFL